MYYIHNTPTQLPTYIKQCQPQPTHTPNPDDATRMQYSHMTLTQPQTYDNASHIRRTPQTPADASRM